MKLDCPFCDSAIEVSEFASSTNFRAIYNLAPILPGHSLVIPKRHVESFLELTEEQLNEMVGFSRHVLRALLTTFGVTGFNWTIQEGEEAGQTISHLHLHLIPRRERDLKHPGDWYPSLRESETKVIDSDERPRLSTDDVERIVSRIKGNITPWPEKEVRD